MPSSSSPKNPVAANQTKGKKKEKVAPEPPGYRKAVKKEGSLFLFAPRGKRSKERVLGLDRVRLG